MTDEDAETSSPQQKNADLPSPNLPLPSSKDSVQDTKPAKKRVREGSTEPGSVASSSTPTHRLATKKNRTEQRAPSPDPTDDNQADANPEEPNQREAGNVGEVRKKVEKMTWAEGVEVPPAPISATPSDMDITDAASVRSTDTKQTDGMKVDGVVEEEEEEDEIVPSPDEQGSGEEEDEEMEGQAKKARAVRAVDEDARMASVEPQSPAASAGDNMDAEEPPAVPDASGPTGDDDNDSSGPAGDQSGEGEGKSEAMVVEKSEEGVVSQPTSPDPQSNSVLSDNGKKRKYLTRNASSVAALDGEGDEVEKVKRVKEDDAGVKTPSRATSPSPKDRAVTPPPNSLAQQTTASAESTPVPAKKPQTTFGAFSTKASAFSPSTSSTTFLSSSSDSAPAIIPIKKPQSTFSAFSSTASPFAGASKSSAASGSALGSNVFASTPSKSSNAFGSYSFGNTSSESPFASKTAKKPVASAVEHGQGEGDDDDEADAEGSAKRENGSFGDILAEKSEKVEDEPTNKMKMSEKEDRITGEEDETTEHQVRAKLFYMETNGGWKERGTGSLHLNTGTMPGTEKSYARLVMRAEGVFRLILNVPLFAGMVSEATDKFVKTTVMENGKLVSLLIKTGSAKAATELQKHIQDNIPFEAGKSVRESLSPTKAEEEEGW